MPTERGTRHLVALQTVFRPPATAGRLSTMLPITCIHLPRSESRFDEKSGLARISHRLNPRLRGGAASPEAGRAEDYSGYENRGEDRKMRSEMPMDGLCLLEDDGVD